MKINLAHKQYRRLGWVHVQFMFLSGREVWLPSPRTNISTKMFKQTLFEVVLFRLDWLLFTFQPQWMMNSSLFSVSCPVPLWHCLLTTLASMSNNTTKDTDRKQCHQRTLLNLLKVQGPDVVWYHEILRATRLRRVVHNASIPLSFNSYANNTYVQDELTNLTILLFRVDRKVVMCKVKEKNQSVDFHRCESNLNRKKKKIQINEIVSFFFKRSPHKDKSWNWFWLQSILGVFEVFMTIECRQTRKSIL